MFLCLTNYAVSKRVYAFKNPKLTETELLQTNPLKIFLWRHK